MRRRRRKVYQWLPWIAAALFVLGVGVAFLRTVGRKDYVAIATALRQGDPLNNRPRDPTAALQLLERFVEEEPEDFQARLEISRAWADLRAWDNAVTAVELAVDATDNPGDQADALTMAMDYLIQADDFDKAVQYGLRAVELQPDAPQRKLRLGTAYLKGSAAAQQEALERFLEPLQKSVHDEKIEKRVEAFITDLWGKPDVGELIGWLMPEGDPVVRQQVADLLTTARERFRLASETLSGYRDYGGFEQTIARAWTAVLLRSGHLYEAYIEAAMALREPALHVAVQRDFLEVQAECSTAIGQHAQAADRYETILEATAEVPAMPIPYVVAYSMYESRALAQQWDWILEHIEKDYKRYGTDPVLRYAYASALEAAGRMEEALQEINDSFIAISLGSKRIAAASLRNSPERRRAIAMLAYRLFTATGDRRAGRALDTVLAQDPADAEALRLRCALSLAEGRPDAATRDALALLTSDRRDHADFQRWLEAADALSLQRYGTGLEQRAVTLVERSEQWQRAADEAAFTTFTTKLGHGRQPPQQRAALPDQLHVRDDPAVSFRVVEELVARNDIPRARNELRKLSDEFPDVQEFRFRLGRLLVREGQYESAAEEFRRLLDALPTDSEVLDLAMRTELALGDQQEAAAIVNRTILDDPLGVGAVRYGQRLVEQGRPEQAQLLIERLVRWTDYDQRTDVLTLAARVQLALGRLPEAEAMLSALSNQAADNVEVALLGLDIGVAKDARGLVDAAVAALKPLAAELFPDQMEQIATRLLEARLYPELLAIFDETVRELPGARPALRAVADACKSLGRHEEADALLGRLVTTDADALLDRFLLLSLRGEVDEVSRRLRLEPVPPDQRPLAELLVLLGNAMLEIPVLQDADPGRRLRELRADQRLSTAGLELMDAIVRLVPTLRRVEDVRPKAVVETPLELYPHAGRDVAALVELARRDPEAARDLSRTLLYLLLFGDRPFWHRESQLLAEHALALAPGLGTPARILAERDLTEGRPRDALLRLQPLLQTEHPDVSDIAIFLRAARDYDHGDWGVAYALYFDEQPAVQQLLGEMLLEWGHPEEARRIFAGLVAAQPGDPDALRGLVDSLASSRPTDENLPVIDRALTTFPDDAPLAESCARALALLPHPDGRAVELMQLLDDQREDLPALSEALARAQAADPAAVEATLERMIERLGRHPAEPGSVEAHQRGIILVRAARQARSSELHDLARQLTNLALQIEPSAVNLYRDLAYLEQADGHLDKARRYLEVLSFVNLADRESAMQLARMDFEQLGQPVRAAEVVRRTFTGGTPPEGVEIVAAEACLLGRPRDAINAFLAIQSSPLVTVDTYLTVARIAYASGLDVTAKPLLKYVVSTLPEGDPRRDRAQWLLDMRLANVRPPAVTAPATP